MTALIGGLEVEIKRDVLTRQEAISLLLDAEAPPD
jgi:hypothetical protein